MHTQTLSKWKCTGCGACCHFRERETLKEIDEVAYKTFMKTQYGILYLPPLSEVTINIWPHEADLLRHEAKRRGIDLRIRPKRALVTPRHELIIMDYFLDHDVCPFYDVKAKKCTAYTIRPLICRAYPLTSKSTIGKCLYATKNLDAYGSEMEYAKELDARVLQEKHVITELLLNGTIIREFDELTILASLESIPFKELRLKEEK